MISEQVLEQFRQSGETVRIIRDEMEQNDVYGIIVAWDDTSIMIRRQNRRVVKLSRSYQIEAAGQIE